MFEFHMKDHLGRDPHHQDHLQASLDLYQGRIDPLDQRVLLLDYHHHQDPLQDSQVTDGVLELLYSQTCIKKSPLTQRKSSLIRQVTS